MYFVIFLYYMKNQFDVKATNLFMHTFWDADEGLKENSRLMENGRAFLILEFVF